MVLRVHPGLTSCKALAMGLLVIVPMQMVLADLVAYTIYVPTHVCNTYAFPGRNSAVEISFF